MSYPATSTTTTANRATTTTMAVSAADIRSLLQIQQMEIFIENNLDSLKKAFARFDKKANGIISLQHLGLLVRSLGFNPTENEIDDLVNEADIDGSGTIDFIEFLQLMNYFWKDEAEETARRVFEVFDLDGSGAIDAEEFRFMLTEFGYEDFTEHDSLEMLAVIDGDGSGEIEREEFVSMFAKSNSFDS